MLRRIAIISSVFAFATAAQAEESVQRQLDAHVHGHGTLNVAIESDAVLMELEAPGADIVGFEYRAKSSEERAKVTAAKEVLANPKELFTLPAAAGCAVAEARVELVAEGEPHEEHDDERRAQHHEGEGHAEHEEHGESSSDSADSRHSEFHASYRFDCARIEAVNSITFAYFERFPRAEELEVNVVSDRGQMRYRVDRSAPTIALQGLI